MVLPQLHVAGLVKSALREEVTSQSHTASLGAAAGQEPVYSAPGPLGQSLPGSLRLGHRLCADTVS